MMWSRKLMMASSATSLLLVSVAFGAGCPPDEHDGVEGEGESGEGEGEGEGDDNCAHDPLLGSLVVEDGFIVVQSQGIPANIINVGFSDPGDGGPPEMFAMTDDLHVVDLGTYPGTTPALPPLVFDAVADADQALARTPPTPGVFPSFLVVDRLLIGTGYTRASDFGGFIGAFSLETGNTSYIPSAGNFAAVTRGDALLVEASSLATADDGLAVYAAAASAVSTFGPLGSTAIGSGNLAVTSDGVLVVGRFASTNDAPNGTNQLFAVGSASVDAILAGDIDLALDLLTPFYEGDLNGSSSGVVGAGPGIAKIDIDGTFTGVGVSFIGIADGGIPTAQGPVAAVTGGSSACTSIGFLAPSLDGHIIMGVKDGAGSRLVEVRRQ